MFKLSPAIRPNDSRARHRLLADTIILRRVQRLSRNSRVVGAVIRGLLAPWRVDETYIKVRRQWVYLYCAVEKQGHTVVFSQQTARDVVAAKRFFSRATKQHGSPG